MVLFSLMEEKKMPVSPNEGPIALIICPSRELAVQTFEILSDLSSSLDSKNMKLRCALCIGGTKVNEQMKQFKDGVHMVVGTPGRLLDMLKRRHFTLDICR